PNRIGKVATVLTLLLVALLSVPSEAATKKAAPKGTGNLFDLLKGYWSGGGTVMPGKGNPERVSCKVTYTVPGSHVSQSMRWAGTDYKFNTSSKLTYSGGKISGAYRNHLRRLRHGERKRCRQHRPCRHQRRQVLRPHEHQRVWL